MLEKEIERVIKLLEAEAARMFDVESRHEGSSRLEHYYSGRRAGVLLALDHLKKMPGLSKKMKDLRP